MKGNLTKEEFLKLNQTERTIGKSISMIYRAVNMYITKELEDYEFSSGQIHYFMMVALNEGIAQEKLSKILYVDKASTARAVAKLEKHGYLKKKPNPKDKRSYKLFLSDKGYNLMPIIHEKFSKWLTIVYEGFKKEEINLLANLLERAVLNINTYNNNNESEDKYYD